jgi:DNA primase
MTTYKDLKSVKYIDSIVNFAEGLLNVDFRKVGKNRFTAYCPFHHDSKDSFRVYVDGKDDVRFHCFGACDGDWDIYDIIKIRNKCSFREAIATLSDYMGIKDMVPYVQDKYSAAEYDESEPDEPIILDEPISIDQTVQSALEEASEYYSSLLLDNKPISGKFVKYLQNRGVNVACKRRFRIGYAPALADEGYAGRALLRQFLDRFQADHTKFNVFCRAGLLRLLNDESVKGFRYYQRYIDFSSEDMFTGNYADYFAGRIVFPVNDIDGNVCGFVGRRPNNQGIRWIKQQSKETDISTKGWLYGIDRAARHIQHYRTVILVEGIFDYFAFYRLFQDTDKPVVVSTLGTNLDTEAQSIFTRLGVKNFIVAYDWDDAGQKAIRQIASEIGGTVYYLGGMKPDEDPAVKLKGVANSISGFSLNKLVSAAKNIQKQTDKPVFVSHLSIGKPDKREIIFKPDTTIDQYPAPSLPETKKHKQKYQYDVDLFLPLLTYDHGNKGGLDDKIQTLSVMLSTSLTESKSDRCFEIYPDFIDKEIYLELGPALILWLRILIEQQLRKRRVKETDSTIADWLNTSRATVIKYKNILRELDCLKIDNTHKIQKLSVRYFK